MRAAIVLAAGASRRFGRADKLLAPLGGKPLVCHAVAAARAARVARVVVVFSHPRVSGVLARKPRLQLVRARQARAGLAVSLAAGLAALRPIEREALVFLGDMPFARAPQGLRLPPGAAAVRPVVNGQPGHPLLVRTAAARALPIRGDRGLAGLGPIAACRGSASNLIDVDSRRALRRARIGSPARRDR